MKEITAQFGKDQLTRNRKDISIRPTCKIFQNRGLTKIAMSSTN